MCIRHDHHCPNLSWPLFFTEGKYMHEHEPVCSFLMLSARIPAQTEPAIPGLKGWPLTVASSATGAGLRRAAMVKQDASAMVMSWAIRSGDSSLSSDSSV